MRNLAGNCQIEAFRIDTEVLAFHDPTDAMREHDIASALVVEWRALTVALLADAFRRLKMDVNSLPLVEVLESGTWRPDVQLRARCSDGSPPVKVINDGTVC
jgi:hypothetical protein